MEKHPDDFLGFEEKSDRIVAEYKGRRIGVMDFAAILKQEVISNLAEYSSCVDCTMYVTSSDKSIATMLKSNFEEFKIDRGPIEIPEYMRGAKLVRILEYDSDANKNKYLVLNSSGYVTDLPASHYRITFQLKDLEDHAIPAYPVYYPTKGPGLFDYVNSSGDKVKAVNTYLPPFWISEFDKAEAKLPKEIDALFSQIEGDMDKKYFLYFLRQMIWSKNSSYLILQGSGGIGKTTMKSVFKALVGPSNFATGKNSIFKSVFNSAIENTKLMVFDEAHYTYDEEPFMKELPNPSISIEAKFKNATKETRIFSSFVLMNNKEKDNYIAYDARKFCPVRLKDRRLETVLSSEEIANISRKCGESLTLEDYDPKYIAQIAKYLWEKCDYGKLFPQGEYRGPKFWQICRTSMFSWQAALIEALEDPGTFLGNARGGEVLAAIEIGELSYSFLQSKILQSFKDGKKGRSAPKFPNDFSSARHFLNIYKDLNGNTVYTTKDIQDKYGYDDFYVVVPKTKRRPEDDL